MSADVCVACASEKVSPWFTKISDVDHNSYHLVRCKRCRTAWVSPRPLDESIERYYAGMESSQALMLNATDEQENYRRVLDAEAARPNASIDAERIARECREFANGNRFLDIGPGYGFYSRSALRYGFKVTALEPSSACRKVYRFMNGFEPVPGMLTEGFVRNYTAQFDVVFMGSVLEHVTDLDATVEHLSALLAAGGIVAIIVPHFRSLVSLVQGRHDHFIIPPEHVNFFTNRGLTALLRRHHLDCFRTYTQSSLNIARVARKVPVPGLGKLLGRSILAVARASDAFHLGMYIFAYFRKEAAN